MTDDERRTRQPLSMTRRYRRGLILTGLLCALAVLTAATVLFQRSYAERIDNYLMQICHGYAAAYEAQDTHSATTLLNLLPEDCPLRITLIDTDGTVLYDTKRGSYIVDVNGDIYAAQTDLPNHADRPEFQQAMASGSACITRESETLQLETHYYAVRIDLPEGAQVLRVGEDVANIWGLSTDTLPLLCGAVVLILLAATLFSWWLTRRMVQPINHLAEHLDTIEADVPYEELIPLARTIQTDRKLREDNETMRREFTANVSHELKTPLTSISGYAELIETGMAKPADVPTFAARIHKEAQRMIALVSDILQLSELDSTQASHSREPVTEMAPVDLAALVKETAQNMTVNARRAYVTLQYDAKPATVRGSRDQLSELTQNLCDNAIRYNRPGGHVELRCGVGGDGCPYFEVEDNGIGMSKEYLPHIFEEFTREHSSTESHITGTGLGLPIVKSLVNLMGGTIDVESELGVGTITTVCLTFGLPTEEQLAAHQHKDEILGQSLQTLSEKRVLLAEDNDLNAEIVLTVLEENGIHAKHVKDGALCLKAVQNAPEDYYDVILMDIQMPNMNGYQAAEAIRALPGKRGEIPIVAMTANAFEEDRRKALESGMNAHIAKPVDVSVLLETLSRFS